MLDDRRGKLANAQTIGVSPLKIDGSPAAIIFYFRSIVSLKEALPTHVQSIREVTNVHQSFSLESIANPRIQFTVDLPAVDNWRFPATLGRLDTVKPDQHRPAMHVGALVMKKNSFRGWIRRRAVNFSTHFRSRQIAVVAKQISTDSLSKVLKLNCGIYSEAPKKQSAVFQQIGFNKLFISTRPLPQIDIVCLGRDDEWE